MSSDKTTLGAFLRTVRYLRFDQVSSRVLRVIPKFGLQAKSAPPRRELQGTFEGFQYTRYSFRQNNQFLLLNCSRQLASSDDWNNPKQAKLWLYNLHYFDWLNRQARADHIDNDTRWLDRWIADNPPGKGVGWEPYPTSLRTVNWIIWFLTGNRSSEQRLDSLATQVRRLTKSLEFHLRGNHLLANAKALVFAGSFFSGDEAENWLDVGLDLLQEQIEEQILSDGAHFELSPMYHSVILADLLDLLSLCAVYPDLLQERLHKLHVRETARLMSQWLVDVLHPDGQIPYFNDAVFGVAPPPSELLAYGKQRGVIVERSRASIITLKASGYGIIAHPPFHLIFDGGVVGPDCQPGHAHADTLAFELSIGQRRVICNSGVSTYERGKQREWERSTSAHATVEFDGVSSAETWSSFRVGRRPHVGAIRSETHAGIEHLECWHDGYRHLRGHPIHRRGIRVSDTELSITDLLEGSGQHRARGLFPLHPAVRAEQTDAHSFRISWGKQSFDFVIDGHVQCNIRDGWFATGFNRTIARQVIEWRWFGGLPASINTRIHLVQGR